MIQSEFIRCKLNRRPTVKLSVEEIHLRREFTFYIVDQHVECRSCIKSIFVIFSFVSILDLIRKE